MAEPKNASERELLKAVQMGIISKAKEILESNCPELNDERYFDYYLLIKALNKHPIDFAKLLIEKGFRVHKNSQDEKTVLECAVRFENTELITILLAKGASADILVTNKQMKTPFHVAIDRNQLLTIELFLSHFDVKTLDEKNLLHYAVEKNKIEVVDQLVKKGLSLKKKNENNSTPVCIAMKNKKYKMLENNLLPHYDVKNINLNSYDDIAPAYIASMTGNLQVVKKFVDFGMSINRPLKSDNDTWACLDHCSGFTLLHCAVKHIKLEIVEFLLSKGADILIKNENGSSPLHIAFQRKEKGIWKTWQEFEDNNSIIALILKANMKLKSNPVNNHGLSHFHVACSGDDSKIVQHFLKLGIVIDQPVNSQCHLYKGFTPLHFAAKFRCRKTLKLLLKNGADVKQTNFEKETALHIAAKEPFSEGARLLMQYGADITAIDSNGNSPVHWAYKKQNYAMIDLLLSVDNIALSNPTNTEGLSHFHIACSRNNVKLVKSFIENKVSLDTCVFAQSDEGKVNEEDTSGNSINVIEEDTSGYSPLHFAVSHNRAKVVQLLLHSGANIKVKDSKGFTPLHTACHYTFEMFREFIEMTLYDLYKREKIALKLKPITDIATVDEKYINGFTGSIGKINWVANKTENLKIINSLLKFESDVNYIDNDGNTLVFYAYTADTRLESILNNNLHCSRPLWNQIVKDITEEICKRKKSILNEFLKREVNLDKCYKNGSILHYICSRNDKRSDEMLELFLKSGANVNITNDKKSTPLHVATSMSNKKLIRVLLNNGAQVDCINPENNVTPLLIATSEKVSAWHNFDIMKLLIGRGANVNVTQSDGRTPLHNLGSQYNSFHYDKIDGRISILVKAGANVNSQDSNGFTPLHVACTSKNFSFIKALLKTGADIHVEDNQGRTVFCYLYEKLLTNISSEATGLYHYDKYLIIGLQDHLIRMNVIGLSISRKTKVSHAKCNEILLRTRSRTNEEKRVLIAKCKAEVELLKDTKINATCTLYNLIFRNVNGLSQLVKNRTFKSILQSKSLNETYPNYSYLLQVKYQEGLVRANILPTAKCLLNNLIGINLPDMCSEHICSYFTNVELKESIETLSSFVDCSVKTSGDDDMQSRTRRTSKRQKVH